MKSKIFVLMALSSALLLVGCKSEGDNKQSDEVDEKEVEKIISEYMTRIGAYMKLQEAYVSESSDGKFGSWTQIGYTAFSEEFEDSEEFKEVEQGVVKGIQVVCRKKLADCPANSSWLVRCHYSNNKPTCDFSIQSKDKKACESISPNFKIVGRMPVYSVIETTYESFNENVSD